MLCQGNNLGESSGAVRNETMRRRTEGSATLMMCSAYTDTAFRSNTDINNATFLLSEQPEDTIDEIH